MSFYNYAPEEPWTQELIGSHLDIEVTSGETTWEIIPPDTFGYATVVQKDKNGVSFIGIEGQKTGYHLDSLPLTDDSILEVRGDVTLVLADDLLVDSGSFIQIKPNSRLRVFTEHDITTLGEGIQNLSNMPQNCIIYSTSRQPLEQTISLAPFQMSMAIYAPFSKVRFNGGGSSASFTGAIVCYNFENLSSGIPFFVDQSLTDTFPFGPPYPFSNISVGYLSSESTSEFSISWNSTYAATYQIERAFSLDEPFEEISGEKFQGTGANMIWRDRYVLSSPQSYYRITVKEND